MKYLYNKNSARQPWPTKSLTIAVLLSLTAMVSQTAGSVERLPIGDLEIYQSAKGTGASIFMMIDVSASMRQSSILADYGHPCDEGVGKSYGPREDESIFAIVGNVEVYFTPKGCETTQGGGTSNPKEFDRLSRLQMALIELLADQVRNKTGNEFRTGIGSIPNEYAIGVGIFGYNGTKAKIVAPLGQLTPDRRIEIIKVIAGLSVASGDGKPTAHGLAEAGAYMMGTTTKTDNYAVHSGFDESVSTSKNSASYISPLELKQCSGNGIYLLTDGVPSGSSVEIAQGLMNKSLQGSSLSVNSCNGLSGGTGTGDGTWGCMAEYTQKLRDPTNPRLLPIKTATAGFGDNFKGLTTTRKITVGGKQVEAVDCSQGAATEVTDDARNLCKLGQRYGDNELSTNTSVFGNGGFYYIAGEQGKSNVTTEELKSSKIIENSIVDFASTLTQVITTSPSGTISIPDDPYRASNQLPYAYLPMLSPDIASSASIWKGNLKKYHLDAGTLYGKSDQLLYKNAAGQLNETTQDLWQLTDFTPVGTTTVDNSSIEAGGVYAQLRTPMSGLASVRTLYVEDVTSATDSKPILRKLSVNASGKPVGFSSLVDSLYTKDNELNKRRLLSFLGFDNLININGLATSRTAVESLTLTQPVQITRVLGGVVHSKPTAISYSSTLNDNGSIIDPRDDYALFGSMDGALHLVDADDGKEEFAIVPKAMLAAQPEALVNGSKKNQIGQPYFGVDAPWLVTTDYTYDLAAKKATLDTANSKGMFAYGGLRMGGSAFYGMNITDKTAPKILFTITPATIGFSRMGQIWSKPTAAKIRMTKDADPVDVLVFGGGYDMAYEDDEYVATAAAPATATAPATAAAPAKGNAIYIINAKTGALIWSTSYNLTNNSNMIHSIVGGITVLDRDNDGLMDHLYAADLGGQVFRADFENARPAKFGFSEVTGFSSKRVIRILNTTPSAAADSKYTYRFYERPVVSFYRNEGGPNNGKIFALVNVISGNRSVPLSTLRDGNTYANRVYGIIDSDVTKASLYDATPTLNVTNLTESNLVNLATTLGATPTEAIKKTAKAEMIAGTKQGWYYPLTRFDGFNNVRYNKGIGDSVVINDLLYTTVYNPDKQYYEVNNCTARISGGSERQLYCLPYGICMDANSVSGTGGYIPAGEGIKELTLGAYNKNNTNLRVLIGTTTITDRINATTRSGYGIDPNKDGSNIKGIVYADQGKPTQGDTNSIGDGSAPEYLFNERYTLQPRAWYERAQ
ncbi:possible pilus assembly protein tip-associated adhesin PilY1 [Psychrobacter arcticus 273-4]|uniref:Possible pilus assembly protein tip-associated adhesin PilY1 n=1 Tax=Psychrobacter arcticus (strain DSM 17307 / VKM B-2377 / 273-4) TaxID=259536 RepID=Q4FV50_PSYA2|nr:PilC/PilY family type IV pilus protein [Psychrobacter arcticus]AAZ18108.1 possible pilus assembly protein tip-associated adhesin PilY1 [Psychrobacter arcticus 273-4]